MTYPARQPPHIPAAVLYRLLAALPDCALLRNDDIVANLRRGGDIDVLVSDPVAAERLVIGMLGLPRSIIRHSYVVEYFYDWGHIDVLPGLEWRGAAYLASRAVVEQARRIPGAAAMPRLAHEALICWFSSLLFGGFFNERYAELIVRAARDDAEAFRAACHHAAGERWGGSLWAAAAGGHPADSAGWVTALRRAVWWQAFRRDPAGTVGRYLSFWRNEIELRRRPPLPSLAFLGPDGSGKSSIISAVAARLGPPVSSGVHVCHWRPGRYRKPPEGTAPVTDPHGKPPRGRLVSTLKLGFLLGDWLSGYWRDLVHLRAKGHILAFDRHYVDIRVDPRRYRYGGSQSIAALIGRCIPGPDVLIVLDAPVEVLRARKQEVSEEESARQRQAYQELARSTPGSYTVNAAQPLQEVVGAVEQIVLEHMARSTAETLRRRGVSVPIPSDADELPRAPFGHSVAPPSGCHNRAYAERGDRDSSAHGR